jgi:protein-tyrosine-phosphatase
VRILFVCAGNICRSPYAELFLRSLDGSLEVASAGLSAWDGGGATDDAIHVASRRGLDLRRHRARSAGAHLVERADLVLAMTASQARRLKALFPGAAERIHTLRGYACGGPDGDIEDPYGMGLPSYEECYREIEECVRRVHLLLGQLDGA